MSYARSVKYITGRNDAALPHYFVELTGKTLFTFEVLNSMCLLDHFDHLLFFLESKMCTSALPIPPFDIILVLMTLVTVSDHYKAQLLRNNDPYNVSRVSLSKRALKVLRFYLQELKEFDLSKHNRYDLELLRCQFFLAIDYLSSRKAHGTHERWKRRKNETGVVYSFHVVDIEIADRKDRFSNPYRSYISCLEQKRSIFGNDLINFKLNHPGEFINMILWTLSNSLQEDCILYVASHDVWMPLLELIVDLFESRQDYFIENEISKDVSKSVFVQRLSESPLSNFLKSIDSIQFVNRFCEYIFLKCDYPLDNQAHDTYIHPVYRGENTFLETYIPRTKYSKCYKYKKSFFLRRKIIGTCFRLLSEVPGSHKLISPRMVADDIINGLSTTLAKFNDIEQFEAFFFTEDFSQVLYFMPLIAEDTLTQVYRNVYRFRQNDQIPALCLVEKLSNVDAFLNECISLFNEGFFMPWKSSSNDEPINEIMKADICLLVLIRYLIYLMGIGAVSSSPSFKKLVLAISRNDVQRKDMASKYGLTSTMPKFRSAISRMLNI